MNKKVKSKNSFLNILIIKVIKKFIFFLLEYKLFKFILSRITYLILKKQAYNFNKNNINILILSPRRLRDLFEFEDLKKFNIIKFPLKLQYFLFSKFSTILIQKRNIFFKENKKFLDDQERIDEFFFNILDYSIKKLKIKIIFSAAAYYIQDAIYFSFFKKKKIKIVIIQRENLIFQKMQNHLIKNYFKNYQPTKADLILTQNESTKKVMKGINFYKESKIVVSGALRMDNFVKKIKNRKLIDKKKKKKIIVFFSFTKNSGINIKKNNSVISANDNKGLVKFFYNTHNLIIDYFSKKSDCNLVIKHKFGDHFLDEIRDNWKKYSGKELPKNCTLTSKANVHNLILNADMVIGFNSTTLFESGLRKIPIIIPAFDEVTSKYKQYFQLEKYNQIYNVVNKKQLIPVIHMKLKNNSISSIVMKKRWNIFNEYVSPIASLSKIKTISELKKII